MLPDASEKALRRSPLIERITTFYAPPYLLNESNTKRDPLEACIAALGGATGLVIHEGQRRAPFREVGRLKALTGHGETTHLLNELTAKRAGC